MDDFETVNNYLHHRRVTVIKEIADIVHGYIISGEMAKARELVDKILEINKKHCDAEIAIGRFWRTYGE